MSSLLFQGSDFPRSMCLDVREDVPRHDPWRSWAVAGGAAVAGVRGVGHACGGDAADEGDGGDGGDGRVGDPCDGAGELGDG